VIGSQLFSETASDEMSCRSGIDRPMLGDCAVFSTQLAPLRALPHQRNNRAHLDAGA